jgi:thioredoxin-dependent peroxiredoxin
VGGRRDADDYGSRVLETGKPAPDFSLRSDSGDTVRLSDLRGRPVVVYFYPKDDTPGCTTQACAIRDSWGEFERAGATVLGISPDSIQSHEKFKSKFTLPFPLLADEDHAVAEAYGAWGEKKNYGRTYMGIIRSGFVIDRDGNLAAAKVNVKADKHREWALAELAKLKA